MKLTTLQLLLSLLFFYFGVKDSIAQQIMLRNVANTDRISSNHYSDLVLSEDGAAYIACFQKNNSGIDEIYICKINQTGNVEWRLGKGVQGRATAIAKDPKTGIWVTGFYRGTWNIDNSQHHSADEKVFVLHLDYQGKQLYWIENNHGSAKPYNIAVNSIGEVMIQGAMGKRVGFDKSVIDAKEEGSFIAVFGPTGSCKELLSFGGEVTEIQNSENKFIMTGRFHTRMSLFEETFVTSGPLDNDGFIACYDGEKSWLYQFGNPGFIKAGYRTSEGGMGLVIDDSNNIQVLGIKDPPRFNPLEFPDHRFANLVLITLDPQGEFIKEKTLVTRTNAKSPVTISRDSKDNYWISAGVQNEVTLCGITHTFPSEPTALLFACTPYFDLIKIVNMEHGPNTAIRSSFSKGEKIAFSGHYKECLKIGEQSITNDGRHALFYLLLNL